eukprot:TRINITY_DN4349_c0_g1_i3.p1 TRINITY_DN4349_c0_g1~~TRINITY_DN4349_c0_g1_i3.p1  ORF type:complete len:287 (-),score=45.64 TRINITY_DN4349_c0_g1_i3:59-919(-)
MANWRDDASSGLGRSPSDESLVQDLEQFLKTPREIVCQTVKARGKGDKKEIRRILGHLPMIVEGRQARHSCHSSAAQTALAPPAETERSGPPGPSTPRASSSRTDPPPAMPRAEAAPGPSEPQPTAKPPTKAAARVTARTRGLTRLAAAETERQVALQQAQSESTSRHKERLAEIGVDPEGMTAANILKLYWTRSDGGGSSYRRMTEKAGRDLEVRATTPRCIAELATPQGHQEIREVHQFLDKWEIDKLADFCRTSKTIMDAKRGQMSLYTSSFGPRTKQFARPP